jgi:tRNA-2-methylthio-N6-dimethylallyladenosine synthase
MGSIVPLRKVRHLNRTKIGGIENPSDIISPMKYHLWTEGCQMNVADSQRVAFVLEKLGYLPTSHPEDANLIVMNTCVVRQSAEDKAYNRLLSLKPLKKKKPELVINLMGCLVGRQDPASLRTRFPMVDVFSQPSDLEPLINFLSQRDGKSLTDKDAVLQNLWLDGEAPIPQSQVGSTVTAFVPIVLGCSHACTYCVIPSRRGAEISRPPEEIIKEVNALVDKGIREVTLLGQIVDRYGRDNPDFPNLASLIKQLNHIEGLFRIRFLTSHPNWLADDLLKTVNDFPKIMPHIEVPVQAGDDEILKAMRRGYSNKDYRILIEKIRSTIPNVSIGTDIIVGFPNETDEKFQLTFDLLDDLKLDVAHLARYSPRQGTVSARTMQDNIPDFEKWERFRRLEELQEKIAREIHSKKIGTSLEVLFEEESKGRWRGRTPNNELVFVETEQELRGQLRNVKIEWAGPWSMIGIMV